MVENVPNQVVSAFNERQVERLTGLSAGQLRYWDRIGFFKPQLAEEGRGSAHSRVYSFKDVVGLRTIALLKGRYGVSTQELQRVAEKLTQYSDAPWSELTFYVWNRKVQFDEPETGKMRGVVDGQYVLFRIQAEAIKRRQGSQFGKFEQHRDVSHNAVVVAGTRIPVATVLRFIEDGYTAEEIIREYPTLTIADIDAVVQHSKSGLAA
jgi:uncharacterized protein (DUF433 family)